MKLNRVGILGAGAVGCYFVAGLQEKLGKNLCVIADGARKTRLEQQGLSINHKQFFPTVKTPEEAHGVDLLLVAVKGTALQASLPDIERVVGENTLVLSLLNGVDSEELIAKRIGTEHVAYSFMKIASQRIANSVVYDPVVTVGVFFGEPDGTMSERVRALVDLFDGSAVHYNVSDNIIRDIWLKYALNISKNIPQAVLNVGLGAYQDSQHVAFLSQAMRNEVVAVASAKGIDISAEDTTTGRNVGTADARYSTLQDLDAKRHTEIDMFCGAMVRMGQELGVPTPFNAFAYHAIKALEEKNDGFIR